SSFLLLSFSIILPYLIVDLKLCNRTPECKFTLAEHFRKKKLTKTNVKELLEGKETLVKGIKNKEKKPYNAVVKIGEKGYIDFISFSK
ncbi:topoisomerase C-terminal repeat-containing protein, partial [Enterococcus faecium]|uniref:topoisomerase C-terminal repeat-containing protein n=2 Tax=Enterococcus faecium TaxID=1352 RepID=UPI00215C55B3